MGFWWTFLRLNQWAKNVLILIPAFFAGVSVSSIVWLQCLIAFFGFSLLSSGVYILNDFKDKDSDKLHPRKKSRLLASKDFTFRSVIIFSNCLFVVGLSILGSLDINLLLLGGIYVMNGFAYNYLLKQIVILDVISLLVGYIIRLMLGAFIADIPISFWLFTMVLCLAAVFILIKRWSDVLVYREMRIELRQTAVPYSKMNLLLIIKILLFSTFLIYFSYLGIVYSLFSGRNLILLVTLIAYLLFIILLLKSIKRTPHEDPLKMIFSQTFNILGMLVCASLFCYVIYF